MNERRRQDQDGVSRDTENSGSACSISRASRLSAEKEPTRSREGCIPSLNAF